MAQDDEVGYRAQEATKPVDPSSNKTSALYQTARGLYRKYFQSGRYTNLPNATASFAKENQKKPVKKTISASGATAKSASGKPVARKKSTVKRTTAK
jgi:hypothetical protein